jgi:hypothetical protein
MRARIFGRLIDPFAGSLLAWARTPQRRRGLGLVLSALINLGLTTLLIGVPSSRGDSLALGAGPGDGDKNAIVVALAGLSGRASVSQSRPKTPETQQDDRMQDLFKRLTQEDPRGASNGQGPTAKDASKLLDDVDAPAEERAHKQSDSRERGDGGSGSNKGDSRGTETRAAPVKTAEIGGDGAPSAGSFQGEVEHCWKRLPGFSDVPVNLEVALNDRGLIARPPKILRPPAAVLDERRLISEERAIRALATCVPYRARLVPGTEQVFRLDFHRSR